MGMLERYRRRRAIRAFSRKLGPALARRFGHTPHYSAEQIGEVIDSPKFRRHREYLAFAYCLYMSQKDFEASDVHGDFDTLRVEAYEHIGPGPGLASPLPGGHMDSFAGPGDFGSGDGSGL